MRKNFCMLAIIFAAACSDNTTNPEPPKVLKVSTAGVTVNDEIGAKLNGEILQLLAGAKPGI